MAINPPPETTTGTQANPPPPPVAPPEPPAPPTPDPRIGELETQVLRGRQVEAILRAQVELGLSPEQAAVVEQANVPLDQIRAFAEKVKAVSHGSGQGPAPAVGAAPVPPSNTTTQPEAAEDREYRLIADQLRDPLLRTRIDPDKLLEFGGNRRNMGVAFRKSWNQHMQDRRNGTSSVGPQPRPGG